MKTEQEISKRIQELEENIKHATKIWGNKLRLRVDELKWVLGDDEK